MTIREIDAFRPGYQNNEQIANQREIYGKCEILIPKKGIVSYCAVELTRPFNFLQYISVLVWIGEGGIVYSISLVVFTVLTVFISYYFVRKANIEL